MSAMDLRSLQAHFGRVMLGGRSEALVDLVRPAGALPPAQSLKVYRRNMRGSLTRALRDVYPVCAQLLDDARFHGIAAGYARLHPSEDNDLNLYGGGFADFLQSYCDEHGGGENTHRLACLPDLARLEWRYHSAYYAADDPVFDFAAFSEVGESDRGRIAFSPSHALALMASDYPLRTVWRSRAHPRGGPCGREYLCVYRDGLRPAIMRLPLKTYHLLGDIIKGVSLDVLSQRFDNLGRRLPLLIEKTWVTSFRLEPDTSDA